MGNDNSLREVGKYLGLAFLLPVCIFIGYVIGFYLDKAFHTKFLTFTFILFGIAAGIIELIREVTRETDKK